MSEPTLTDSPAVPPVFASPWEAQVFALVLALRERGWVQGDEWMQHVAPAACGPGGAPADTSFETWLRALESLVVARGWGDAGTLAALADAWATAAERTPHGQPIVLDPDAQARALTASARPDAPRTGP